MTREEAIERLELCQNVCNDCLTCASHDEALNMAIAALREQSVPDTNVVKTNADHIRSMSDEELASVIMCPYDVEPDLCCSRKSCYACSLEWLQQPYKEDA